MARTIRPSTVPVKWQYTEQDFQLKTGYYPVNQITYARYKARLYGDGFQRNAPKGFRKMLNRLNRSRMNHIVRTCQDYDTLTLKTKRNANWLYF